MGLFLMFLMFLMFQLCPRRFFDDWNDGRRKPVLRLRKTFERRTERRCSDSAKPVERAHSRLPVNRKTELVHPENWILNRPYETTRISFYVLGQIEDEIIGHKLE